MGALLGMIMAAGPGTPVERLLMNDAGPVVTKDSLQRIAAYLGTAPDFADMAEAEAYIRQVHAPFGPLTDDQWAHLARHSVREGGGGRLVLKYDPGQTVPKRGRQRFGAMARVGRDPVSGHRDPGRAIGPFAHRHPGRDAIPRPQGEGP